jgi:tRNA pseudouridine55 synthase
LNPEGILLVDKPYGWTSFRLVHVLRKRLGVKKIGHAGTLDPCATGVMVMLIGRRYTRLSNSFLSKEKEYVAKVRLGITTETYDREGKETGCSSFVPSLEEVENILKEFQGEVQQIPPMYSAKKKQGKKLYELARQGKEVEREPVKVWMKTELMSYVYPFLELRVTCSKGTYIRSLADDAGKRLGCGAHLADLQRTRSGDFHLEECIAEKDLDDPLPHLKKYL